MGKIKQWMLNIVAKKIVAKIGQERWEASQTKIGGILTGLAVIAKGFDFPIPEEVIYIAGALGVAIGAKGIRDAETEISEDVKRIAEKLEGNEKA